MYAPTDKHSWTGRIDSNEGDLGQRWHQKVKLIDLSTEKIPSLKKEVLGIVILGFKCDEGVRRNKGRTGAAEGPEALRKACSNHANHFHENTLLFDGGNVICIDGDLESAQSELRSYISKIRSSGYYPFVFGGGHEVAYPHFMGIIDSFPKNKSIGIINIDAHFDLRIPEERASSGTPFYQISEECTSLGLPFKYLCIGIQQSSNTQALFKRAIEHGVEYILSEDINDLTSEVYISKIDQFIESIDYVYLTVCLDVFDISIAPGVSAPSVLGLKGEFMVKMLQKLMNSGKVISTDIAELNPSLDQNEMTAKLAAKLVYEIITSFRNAN